MSHGKQFTLYTNVFGPNGWKVAIVLEELGLTYESIHLTFEKGEHKAPDYLKVNPNGRIPALIDHKANDFVLWESLAIIQYLVDKYDPEHKISSVGEAKYLELQWLAFQISGQGPYFGQAAWFQKGHSEKIPSAIERYDNEIKRVFGVLESVLAKRSSGYLVGDKATVADLAFITWNKSATTWLEVDGLNFEKDFPLTAKWHNTLMEREAVKKVFGVKYALMAQHQ